MFRFGSGGAGSAPLLSRREHITARPANGMTYTNLFIGNYRMDFHLDFLFYKSYS
jgi:hypothetical protein